MVCFKSLAAAAGIAVFSASGAAAGHWLTIVNGCSTRTVKPTLALSVGLLPNMTSTTLAPGQRTVFKLEQNVPYVGIVTNALDGDASSFLQFAFASGTGNSLATYALSNFRSFSIPQVAVAWPDTNSCKTRRCYSKDCDDSNAIDVGVTNALKILQATSSCLDTNTGITLYYCSAQ